MGLKYLVGLLLLFIVFSCNQRISNVEVNTKEINSKQVRSKTGLTIEYGPNLGTNHIDTLGIKYFYVHMTATITNDTSLPIHLQFALSKEYLFPDFCEDIKYRAFLLPKELTPDTATVYNNIVNGQHDFLNAPIDKDHVLNKTLKPHEYLVVTFGILAPNSTKCKAVPRALFSYESRMLYNSCDVQINQGVSHVPELEMGIKLEFYKQRKFIPPEDHCAIIPCGVITYLND